MPAHGSSPSYQYLNQQSPSPSSSRVPHFTPPSLTHSTTSRFPITTTTPTTTPTKKLASSPRAQPTLAMSLVAPSPRRSSNILQTPSSPPPRPPSRSECLLRDTLVKDNTRRTRSTSRARSRSPSMCSDCADDVFFQPALLFTSSRRNSATSTSPLPHIQPKSFYVPDEREDSSYAQLLRARSFSDCKGYTVSNVHQEKLNDQGLSTSLPRAYVLDSEPAPHQTVLRKRLDRVLQRGMRQRQRTKKSPDEQSSSGSPPSLARSLSNSCSNSQASEKTHVSAPEVECSIPAYSSPRQGKGHRYAQSASVTYTQAQKSPRTPQSQRDNTPWITTPLPPSPLFSTPTKKSPSSAYDTPSPHTPAILATFSSANSQVPVPVGPPQFDPRAASLACKQLPGYVSFASVAGLGAPPGVGDDDVSVKELERGRGLGRWWIF